MFSDLSCCSSPSSAAGKTVEVGGLMSLSEEGGRTSGGLGGGLWGLGEDLEKWDFGLNNLWF